MKPIYVRERIVPGEGETKRRINASTTQMEDLSNQGSEVLMNHIPTRVNILSGEAVPPPSKPWTPITTKTKLEQQLRPDQNLWQFKTPKLLRYPTEGKKIHSKTMTENLSSLNQLIPLQDEDQILVKNVDDWKSILTIQQMHTKGQKNLFNKIPTEIQVVDPELVENRERIFLTVPCSRSSRYNYLLGLNFCQ